MRASLGGGGRDCGHIPYFSVCLQMAATIIGRFILYKIIVARIIACRNVETLCILVLFCIYILFNVDLTTEI